MLCIFYNRKTVLHGGSRIPHPFGISLFEDSVFFTDWTKMAVMKANKFTETNPQVYYQSSLRPFGVTVFHSVRQPHGKPHSNRNHQVLALEERFSQSYKVNDWGSHEIWMVFSNM